MKYFVDKNGYYGEFGGTFIPEMLYHNVIELQCKYKKFITSYEYQKIYKKLLKNYVGRPTPLFLCKKYSDQYHAKIYLKREDLNHTGSHKINNAIGQALLAIKLGKKKIVAETGAGQHGVATATVCALMHLECIIFMGEKDIQRQYSNVIKMKGLGAEVVSVSSGNKTLKDAVNEAIRYWINHPESYYLIGSTVGPHPYPQMVADIQSIISEEVKVQLKEAEGFNFPNYVVTCIGGGSNAAGSFYHFLENDSVHLVAVEAAGLGITTKKTASAIQCGSKGVLHGSMTFILQDKDGQVLPAYSISPGLDYPGIGPMFANLFVKKRVNFLHSTDEEALQAGYELIRSEGIIPALESAHALAALKKISFKENDVVIVTLSGRGDKDIDIYNKFFVKLSKNE
ncbi:tryptophan synthase subunit beta [Blattabacterium sp. (Blaberus giganteus)]|uniref:tryptophan synthase subunit beta n=1 Tax=Blattabacterium sp. (Blaberus giganteus) TaxID=1186051 RepID=UPI00025F6ED4|nr:tryptophan synthase subunit beta [Blattabacterium sp. (Blaberus giganteus)]AFJ90661.1 bifunctional phosphoribosylanthranilate isomerase/tryptophan synthase subunit beta [Blattabacterium sp. (Blaberus giganteus)]